LEENAAEALKEIIRIEPLQLAWIFVPLSFALVITEVLNCHVHVASAWNE
jgi:hypothetical protein